MAVIDRAPVPSDNEPPPLHYRDLRAHIEALDRAGLLYRIDRPINKDTEMHPLVRWQYRGGIADKDRKAFQKCPEERFFL